MGCGCATSDPRSGPAQRGARARHLAAAAVFALAAGVVYAPVWRAGGDEVVPVGAASGGGAAMVRSDVIFEVWLTSRNARTLAAAPHRLFDTEHCAPAERTLTLGIPMVTLGALAIPAFLASGDPILSWNVTLVLLSLVGAAAMYALVVHWTGSAGAGIVAGLFYAFHPSRLATIAYPSVWDGTWTVLALLFAERLFATGRWRHAVGLAAAVALQIGAGFYPLVAAFLLGAPFLLWLLLRDGPRLARPGQLAFVACVAAAVAAWLLGPYLAAETGIGDGRLRREAFFHASLRSLAPGTMLFPGWSRLGLVVFALAARRAWIPLRIGGDPRWALLAGAILAALVALGDAVDPLPNLHRLLAAVLPGLDAVRVLIRVLSGVHLALAVLAGLGAAALIRLGGRTGLAIAAVLVLACGLEMLRAPSLGLDRSWRWRLEAVRPDPAEIAFFDELAELGNDGPLLELPVASPSPLGGRNAPRILLSLFHRRRTSACFGSYPPPGRDALHALASRLPDPGAVDALSRLGFTTVIVRHGRSRRPDYRTLGRLGAAAERGEAVAHVHSTDAMSAFELLPGAAP